MSYHLKELRPETLAADRSFQKWVLDDQPDATAFWTLWMEENPLEIETVEKAKLLVLMHGRSFSDVSDRELSAELFRLSHKIGARSVKPLFTWAGLKTGWPIAAAIALLIVGAWSWYRTPVTGSGNDRAAYTFLIERLDRQYKIYRNDGASVRRIVLSDQSIVELQPQSELTVPRNFNYLDRTLFLDGDAFFDVARNEQKPFVVFANNLATRVLGTSFTVSTATRGVVKVQVRSGRVTVFPITEDKVRSESWKVGKEEGMVITPNQQVVYDPGELKITRGVVETPQILKEEMLNARFVFRRTPIREVFTTLQEAYGIPIVFDEKKMESCFLSAVLNDESLLDKVELICRTIDAGYRQLDGTILIESGGCAQ